MMTKRDQDSVEKRYAIFAEPHDETQPRRRSVSCWGLRGEQSIAELAAARINTNLYYRWSKEFLEAGKQRLAGDTVREATSDEVKQLRSEAAAMKEALAEQLMENRLLKKSVIWDVRTICDVFGFGKVRNHPNR